MVLDRIAFTDNLSDCIGNRLIPLPENARENLTLNRDAQRLTDLVKELVELVLLGHRTLHFQEVITDLFL